MWWVRVRTTVQGSLFLAYVAAYGVARFIVEFFRGNPAIFAWGIPAAQIFGGVMALGAIALCLSQRRERRSLVGF